VNCIPSIALEVSIGIVGDNGGITWFCFRGVSYWTFVYDSICYACEVSNPCEDTSGFFGDSSIFCLPEEFVSKPGGIDPCSGGVIIDSPYSIFGKPLHLCLWKVQNLTYWSGGNVWTLSCISS
jgi:hypothetical protein